MSDSKKKIADLIDKAAAATESGDAMRFSQAALNAANAVVGLASMERLKN